MRTQTLDEKELAFFKPDPNQPRKEFSLADLERLEESLFVSQHVPLIAAMDGTIRDGERRWRAASLKGRIKTLAVVITDEVLSPTELKVFQITSSVHRAALTGYEMWQACNDLLALSPKWQLKDLATHLQLDASTVTRYLSPSRCIKAWQDALKAGTIVGISDCYEASKLPEDAQAALLDLKKSVSRNAIAAAGRKRRNGHASTVKLSRVRAPLPSGVEVVFSGKELGLDDVIDALGHLLKDAKKANECFWDVKTWSATLKDRAKASA